MKRSRVLIVLGIINLVYACGWLMTGLSALVFLAIPQAFYTDNNPMGVDLNPIHATYAAMESPVFKSYWVVNGVLTFLVGAVLAAGGVGLLMARPWGRKLSVGWAVAAVLLVAASVGMTHGYLTPEILSLQKEPPLNGAISGILIAFSLVVRWAYPVVLMVLLPRPNISAAFELARRVRAGQLSAYPLPGAPAALPVPAAMQSATTTPPPPPTPQHPPALRTWRDDPWNDPDAT